VRQIESRSRWSCAGAGSDIGTTTNHEPRGSAPSEPRPRPSAGRSPARLSALAPRSTAHSALARLLRRSDAGPCILPQSNRPTDPRPAWRPSSIAPGFGNTAGHFLVLDRQAAEQDGRGRFLASRRTRQSRCHADGLLVLAGRSLVLRPSWSSLLRPTRTMQDQQKTTRTLTAGWSRPRLGPGENVAVARAGGPRAWPNRSSIWWSSSVSSNASNAAR